MGALRCKIRASGLALGRAVPWLWTKSLLEWEWRRGFRREYIWTLSAFTKTLTANTDGNRRLVATYFGAHTRIAEQWSVAFSLLLESTIRESDASQGKHGLNQRFPSSRVPPIPSYSSLATSHKSYFSVSSKCLMDARSISKEHLCTLWDNRCFLKYEH